MSGPESTIQATTMPKNKTPHFALSFVVDFMAFSSLRAVVSLLTFS
jgi:hypothetical protein